MCLHVELVCIKRSTVIEISERCCSYLVQACHHPSLPAQSASPLKYWMHQARVRRRWRSSPLLIFTIMWSSMRVAQVISKNLIKVLIDIDWYMCQQCFSTLIVSSLMWMLALCLKFTTLVQLYNSVVSEPVFFQLSTHRIGHKYEPGSKSNGWFLSLYSRSSIPCKKTAWEKLLTGPKTVKFQKSGPFVTPTSIVLKYS